MMNCFGSRFGIGLGSTLLKAVVLVAVAASVAPAAFAQQGFFTRDDVIKYTPDWKGERFPDGRPKVSADLLKRAADCTIEDVWGFLRQKGYRNQYEGGWMMLHNDRPFAGRALAPQAAQRSGGKIKKK